MRSGNPVLNPNIFNQERTYGVTQAMTVQGTVNKGFVLWGLLLLSASWVWGQLMQPANPVNFEQAGSAVSRVSHMVGPAMMGGLFGGFVLAMVTCFKRQWAAVTAPLYALCEGLFLGGLSAVMEQAYPGMVMQAVALTFGVFFCMLAVYRFRLIQVDNRFITGIVSATGAVFLVYLASWILSFFGIAIPLINGSGPVGIGFSLLVVGIAAFNLILDFYIIEQGEAQGAQKYMEWYGAFGLMVTLVWLYVEILRLLVKLSSRR